MGSKSDTRRGLGNSSRYVGLSARGGLVLGVGVLTLAVAYMSDWPELLILSMFCGALVCFSFLFVFVRKPRLSITRFYSPGIVGVQTTGVMNLRLTNRDSKPLNGASWFDYLPWGAGSTAPRVLASIGLRETETLQYSFIPPRRGVVNLGPLVIKIDDPFKLVKGEFALGEQNQVIVAPRVFDLDQSELDVAADTGSARLFQHRSLAGEHDIMTRDYRPGDAMRKVHWKATAHHGELMVREEDKRSHAEAVIILDTRRNSYTDVLRTSSSDKPESERFEWALEFVASIRGHLVSKGQRVNVVETAIPQLADASHVEEFIGSLARIKLSYQNGNKPIFVESDSRGNGSIFAVLDDPDEETIEAMTEQVGLFHLAQAFLLSPSAERSSTKALESRLKTAGWQVCVVTDGVNVPSAWHAAGMEHSVALEQGARVGSNS